ncbi:MAG TPA: ATP-binding protein [Kofleriaceae bacterium]|nr:ATP-binding protein [Kofleriaceae bacterium]
MGHDSNAAGVNGHHRVSDSGNREGHDGLGAIAEPRLIAADAADTTALLDEPAATRPPVVIPDLIPHALGGQLEPIQIAAPPDVPSYASPRDHIDDLIRVVELRAARAIADAWNTGLLSLPSEDQRPFEREVLAIIGRTGSYAPGLLSEIEEQLGRHSQHTAARVAATIAAGTPLPYVEMIREMGLSPTAAQILLVVLAPLIRGEIARLYGVLANDEHRPLVDRFLVEVLLAAGDPRVRSEVAGELAPDAPLIRYGLVQSSGESPLFAELTADPVLVDRIRGRATGSTGVTVLRDATRSFSDLQLPAELKRALVLALAESRPEDAPLRLVLRGRRGAGRHSIIAALAARVGRRVAAIDASRLPRNAVRLAAGLRIELIRALLRRSIPMVSGLETVEAGGAEGQEAITEVIRNHPGPLVIRATPEGSLPIGPGYVSLTFPSVSESDRTQFWTEALTRAGLPVTDIADLALRFRIGPGVIERVIGEVVARGDHASSGADAGPAIIEAATQHIASRLGHVASHVTHLARWEQATFPEDILDSLKEFIGRVRHRRTVYERWGFDTKMTSSRGLSALFYGPPGTGKSMVAGLIARELGLELYRVDLSRVVSKWIGETEKNLSEVFDAAEDGQVMVLFDEADSLFARRTEVKSSVDRYANLEVNYLLQRLDSFEGICILTTNLEGSIDAAFKRRMSLRLHFPFPDEEMRARIWAAHLPPETPTEGDFDFAALAHRFPLSGGYIRNSALRAAFLAAQEERPLSQSHLIRAIQLEYRELGKLSTTGRME